MDEENELFSLEELEMTNMEIENPYDKLFEKINSLINQLKDGTPKSKEKMAELFGKANTILTQFDTVTRQLIEDGLTQEDVQPIVLKIMELRNILDNLTNKGGKKRKSKKSKKRNSKKRRRKSMKR